MKEKLMVLGAVAAVILLVLLIFPQHTKNKAIALEETVETARSDIKVQEKRRIDLIFNLADCVKQYEPGKRCRRCYSIVEGSFL